MKQALQQKLIKLLDKYMTEVETKRLASATVIQSRDDLIKIAPSEPGVYWIVTDMPTTEIQNHFAGKKIVKRVRKTRKKGESEIIRQKDSELRVIYIGTQASIRTRLLEHLFNEGNKKTVKLGFEIHAEPYSKYQWKIYFAPISNLTLRYAAESWWRANVGWPEFCLR